MKLGSTVKWKSQSKGYKKVKTGVVLAVVPPKVSGVAVFTQRKLSRKYSGSTLGVGQGRVSKSYLVAVAPKKGSKAKPRIYWPVVDKLALV